MRFGPLPTAFEQNNSVRLAVPGGFFSIQTDKTPKVDHFCFGVAGFDTSNPKATLDKLSTGGTR